MIYLGGKYCALLILSLTCRTIWHQSVQLDPKGQQHTSAVTCCSLSDAIVVLHCTGILVILFHTSSPIHLLV